MWNVKSLHSLTPEISDEEEDPYSVESLVVHGLLRAGLPILCLGIHLILTVCHTTLLLELFLFYCHLLATLLLEFVHVHLGSIVTYINPSMQVGIGHPYHK